MVFLILFWFCSAVILLWGLLSLFSPGTWFQVAAWQMKAEKWSTAKSEQGKWFLSQRIAGLLAIIAGGLMLRQLLHRVSWVTMPRQALHPLVSSPNWSSLLFGLAMISYGMYLQFRPQTILSFRAANVPDREPRQLSATEISQVVHGGRILGAILIVGGAYVLFL